MSLKVYYTRPPFFLEVSASSPADLARKVAALDARAEDYDLQRRQRRGDDDSIAPLRVEKIVGRWRLMIGTTGDLHVDQWGCLNSWSWRGEGDRILINYARPLIRSAVAEIKAVNGVHRFGSAGSEMRQAFLIAITRRVLVSRDLILDPKALAAELSEGDA